MSKCVIKSPNKEFKNFLDSLNLAYQQFCLLEETTKEISDKNLFWKIIRVSLLRSYLLELSKIFEKQNSRFDPVLSIYYLLDFEFRGHEKTLKKLKKLRDKFLVHTDLKISYDLEKFLKEIALEPKEIDPLFRKTYEVASKIASSRGQHGDYINFFYHEFKKQAFQEIAKIIKESP